METTVAAAVGVAVVRYRLYAIERLINRTLVYALLTLVLAGVVRGATLGLGVSAGRGSAWVTAAATLAVAVGFRPLRAACRARSTAASTRSASGGAARAGVRARGARGARAPEEIGEVLADALRDPLAELVFWLPESEAYADGGRASVVAALPAGRPRRTEIPRDGARTAVLLHDPALLEQRRPCSTASLAAAALSIEIARLRVEVRLSCRGGGVAGADRRGRLRGTPPARARPARRRAAATRLARPPAAAAPALAARRGEDRSLPRSTSVVDEVGSAIADLRQIAAGVRPARLDDGLAAALQDLARTRRSRSRSRRRSSG